MGRDAYSLYIVYTFITVLYCNTYIVTINYIIL